MTGNEGVRLGMGGNPSTKGTASSIYPTGTDFLKNTFFPSNSSSPTSIFFLKNKPRNSEHNISGAEELSQSAIFPKMTHLHSDSSVSQNTEKTLFPEVSNSPQGWIWNTTR